MIRRAHREPIIPNTFAYLVLGLWPLVIIFLFTQLAVKPAVIWSILLSYMFLPVATEFHYPGVPALDKSSLPNIMALLCALAFAKRRLRLLPKQPIVLLLMVVFVLSPALTTLSNADPIVLTEMAIPGLTFHDTLSICFNQIITLIPFVLGYGVLGSESGHAALIKALVFAGLIYSLPMLLEIRLSPQLHNLAYGFSPHQFAQQMRMGGFRAMVFMGHGLLTGIFICMALLATAGLARQRRQVLTLPIVLVLGYLGLVLVLSKAFGAIMFGLIFAPLIYFARPRLMLLTGALVAMTVLAYPALRGSGWISTQTVASVTGSVGTERQGSLNFRMENEDALLKKASQRPYLGWGTWGRNRIYAEGYDSDLSVTDGTWIIVVGSFGWIGYLAAFGLLCAPLIGSAVRFRQKLPYPIQSAALHIVLAVNLLDLIPNSSLRPITWLIAGALTATIVQRRAKSDGAVGDPNMPSAPAPEEAVAHSNSAS